MSIRSRASANFGANGATSKDKGPVDGRPVQAIDDEGLSHRLTFFLNCVVTVLIDASASHFRSLGLSIPAARALTSLYECGGEMTVGNLARTTSTDLPTMSHILRRLEAKG